MRINSEQFVPVKNDQPYSFRFEEDFIEPNVRCIPMIVRFKLDICRIKLKLGDWNRLNTNEKHLLINIPCATDKEITSYHSFLRELIIGKTGSELTLLPPQENLAWADLENIADELWSKAKEFSCTIDICKWKSLNNLQRFALLKLCRPGHENHNFPKAMIEFGIMK